MIDINVLQQISERLYKIRSAYQQLPEIDMNHYLELEALELFVDKAITEHTQHYMDCLYDHLSEYADAEIEIVNFDPEWAEGYVSEIEEHWDEGPNEDDLERVYNLFVKYGYIKVIENEE